MGENGNDESSNILKEIHRLNLESFSEMTLTTKQQYFIYFALFLLLAESFHPQDTMEMIRIKNEYATHNM